MIFNHLRKLYWLAPIIVFLLLWQTVSVSGIVNKSLFPPPTAVFASFVELGASGELFLHINTSLWRVFVGLLVGGAIGMFLGLLTGRNKLLDLSLTPLFQVFRSFPPVAIIPLVIVWLGIGETAKLFSIAFAVFFPVWLNTHIGSSQIPAHYLQAASTLTTSTLKKWFGIILPASLPFIIAGIRTGIALAFIMVFVAELAGASSGIGYLISISHLAYRIDKMMVGLVLLGFFGAVTDYLFSYATRRVFPWIAKP